MENEIAESLHALYGVLTFRERLKLIFGERLNIQGRNEVFIPGNPIAIDNVLLAEATHNNALRKMPRPISTTSLLADDVFDRLPHLAGINQRLIRFLLADGGGRVRFIAAALDFLLN